MNDNPDINLPTEEELRDFCRLSGKMTRIFSDAYTATGDERYRRLNVLASTIDIEITSIRRDTNN